MTIERRTLAAGSRRPRVRTGLAVLAVGATLVGGAGLAVAGVAPQGTIGGDGHVGDDTAEGVLLASNQYVKPIGQRSLIDNGQLISSTISPDGSHVAALTTGRGIALTIFDADGEVVQQAGTSTDADLRLDSGSVTSDGPLYSADGRSLWMGQTTAVLRFPVAADGTVGEPVSIPIPNGPERPAGLPSGMALSDDGGLLYVALNGQNQVGIIDTATDRLVGRIDVGNAPRQVAVVGDTAYVSNEGGRPARGGEFTNDSYGTAIVADPVTGAAKTGTVSVVDLVAREQTSTIKVGLQPTDLFVDGSTLFVTNSNEDSVSVVDTAADEVVQTFNTNPLAGSDADNHHPNAVAMPDPEHLLVSLGRDNALAVYGYDGPQQPVRYLGLLPTDFYPTGVETAPDGRVVVTNDRGIGTRGPLATIDKGPRTTPATGYNTLRPTGSLTAFEMPGDEALGRYTHQVFLNNGWDDDLAQRQPAPRRGRRPVPVPARTGERSPIKHVFLIIKENRSYDQVLGDDPRGDGDPDLAQFGEEATPNLHKIVGDWTLFDNFYDIGTNSADGNNWLMQADANDYLETEFGNFVRSYPAEGGDALAYQQDGFLWNAAARAGKTVRDFGEYVTFQDVPEAEDGGPTWIDWYRTSRILEGKEKGPLPVPTGKYPSYADIPSLNQITAHAFPKYNLDVPDQYRTDIWLKSFRRSERTGKLANLTMLRMPVDHTSGLSEGNPYPIAQVADNDLAVGRIVDEISHSRFWRSSAIFILQDDTQNGVDHVDGHRGPLALISPWARRGNVDSTYYTQLNVIATIERILGMEPMNQKDRAAEPMYGAFKARPTLRRFDHVRNRIPLTYGLGRQTFSTDGLTRAKGERTSRLADVPAAQQDNFARWSTWSEQQRFTGPDAAADYANPEQLNRLTWYIGHDWSTPYPGDPKIYAPDEVPGRYLVTSDSDG